VGDHHYFVTSPAWGYNDETEIRDFERVLRDHFRDVLLFFGAYAMHDKDLDNCGVEFDMPDRVDALSGILKENIAIVAAWDHPWQLEEYAKRERLWIVPGWKTMGLDKSQRPKPKLTITPWEPKKP